VEGGTLDRHNVGNRLTPLTVKELTVGYVRYAWDYWSKRLKCLY